MNHKFTFIDLFSGIGGFRMALNNIGGTCLNFSEINKDAISTYCDNFNESQDLNLGDVTKISALPAHDLLTGGVPCQSWSIAGKNLGFDDDRGQLWNDAIYLLNQSKPKVFIFENVKGLIDPRNKSALNYILEQIKKAGYHANHFLINSYDYGVPQNRLRIFIIGFLDKSFLQKFKLPYPLNKKIQLKDIFMNSPQISDNDRTGQTDLFGNIFTPKNMSLSNTNGFNDYFLFNDLRNGHSTIHSWDIINTTKKQKDICLFLLKNRRKSDYGSLDGNPLSLAHFQEFDANITKSELNELVTLNILQIEKYLFEIKISINTELTEDELAVVNESVNDILNIDLLKGNKLLKSKKIQIKKILTSLESKKIIFCSESRYDFKNTKISTGLFGVNRIFLPSSDIFPTLVASDSNDYITLKDIFATTKSDFKKHFLQEVYEKKNYRKITKEEACLMQGFPKEFKLPESRPRWMKLLGNSVSIPVVEMLGNAISKTGVFDKNKKTDE